MGPFRRRIRPASGLTHCGCWAGAFYGLLLLAVSFVGFVIVYTIAAFMFSAGPAYILLLAGFGALVAYAVHLHS